MNAKDLMIGDWVLYKDVPVKPSEMYNYKKKIDVKSRLISLLDMIIMDEQIDWENGALPIPLTEEILKANGWTSVPEYSLPFVTGQQEITDYHWSPNFNSYPLVLLQMADDSGMFKVFNGVTIYYVHELQHALRLCGLSELADNFVVE